MSEKMSEIDEKIENPFSRHESTVEDPIVDDEYESESENLAKLRLNNKQFSAMTVENYVAKDPQPFIKAFPKEDIPSIKINDTPVIFVSSLDNILPHN